MRVLSLGAGVQSSTLLLMAVHGELEIDRAIFADTQWEPKAVYDWLETLMPIAEKAGIPVDAVTAGNIREDALASRRSASMPLHVRNADGTPGMLRRQCTKEYKIRPVQRRLRELGATAKQPITLLMGISVDEAQRMRDSRVKYAVHEYPLVDRRMTRWACLAWMRDHGYPEAPKSACIACPFMDNARWRTLKQNAPGEWADAVDFDRRIRRMTRIDGEAFVHRSLLPLDMVDLSGRRFVHPDQMDLFDQECEGVCGV